MTTPNQPIQSAEDYLKQFLDDEDITELDILMQQQRDQLLFELGRRSAVDIYIIEMRKKSPYHISWAETEMAGAILKDPTTCLDAIKRHNEECGK